MRKILILSSFFIICLCFIAAGFFRSQVFNFKKTAAGGFGISPPYFNNENLKPGDKYEASLTLLRSDAGENLLVNPVINMPFIKSWFTIEPSKDIVFPAGSYDRSVGISVKVPPDATAGNYKGQLFFIATPQSSAGKTSGSSIQLGVLAEITLKVTSDRPKAEFIKISPNAGMVYEKYKGRFIGAEGADNFYYVFPLEPAVYEINSSSSARALIKKSGVGINNGLIRKIPAGLFKDNSPDADKDGLSDALESAIGSSAENQDTDKDGYSDLFELNSGFDPLHKLAEQPVDKELAKRQAGKFLLQVEARGEAWYISPSDLKKYFLGSTGNFFANMKYFSLPVGTSEIDSLFSD